VKDWQNTVLFLVGVGGAVFLLFAPAIGLGSVLKNPIAATGVTTILAYVLTQRHRDGKDKGSTTGTTPKRRTESRTKPPAPTKEDDS
jgi:hypothetical protein